MNCDWRNIFYVFGSFWIGFTFLYINVFLIWFALQCAGIIYFLIIETALMVSSYLKLTFRKISLIPFEQNCIEILQ